ncbi:MAG: hypothetical protein L0Z50_01730, partial [Verrucomicrobiales bacterium]|nr:hypothetical protein [Verrucomicrobiales bacterium]
MSAILFLLGLNYLTPETQKKILRVLAHRIEHLAESSLMARTCSMGTSRFIRRHVCVTIASWPVQMIAEAIR